MPKKLHDKLEKQAKEKGLTGKRKKSFIYGILRKRTGWKPERERD